MAKPSEEVACMCCDGNGRYYLWEDRDPVEGFKLANKHNCNFCDGKRVFTSEDECFEAVKAYWKEFNRGKDEKLRLQKDAEGRRKKLRQQARAKLTVEEMEALGVEYE